MRNISKVIVTTALAGFVAGPISAPAYGHETTYPHHHTYHGHTYYAKKYCRYSSGTTGLVAGGATGAVVGSKVIGGGVAGIAVGAVGGALAGRAVDRTVTEKQRCYYK